VVLKKSRQPPYGKKKWGGGVIGWAHGAPRWALEGVMDGYKYREVLIESDGKRRPEYHVVRPIHADWFDHWIDVWSMLDGRARMNGRELQEVCYGGDGLTDGAEVILGLIYDEPWRVYAAVVPGGGPGSSVWYYGIERVETDEK
jgi:hypothetical protein